MVGTESGVTRRESTATRQAQALGRAWFIPDHRLRITAVVIWANRMAWPWWLDSDSLNYPRNVVPKAIFETAVDSRFSVKTSPTRSMAPVWAEVATSAARFAVVQDQSDTPARIDVFDCIERFYNRKRRHGAAGRKSPLDYQPHVLNESVH